MIIGFLLGVLRWCVMLRMVHPHRHAMHDTSPKGGYAGLVVIVG